MTCLEKPNLHEQCTKYQSHGGGNCILKSNTGRYSLARPGKMRVKELFNACLTTLLLLPLSVHSQEVTVYGQTSLWHADSLCDMEFTCDYSDFIPSDQVLIGYAYHPDGSLLMVTTTFYADEPNKLIIYVVRQFPCDYSMISEITLAETWRVTGAANIDFQGRLYLTVVFTDPVTQLRRKSLFRMNNLAVGSFEEVLELRTNQASQFWEIHLTSERIYLVAIELPQ